MHRAIVLREAREVLRACMGFTISADRTPRNRTRTTPPYVTPRAINVRRTIGAGRALRATACEATGALERGEAWWGDGDRER